MSILKSTLESAQKRMKAQDKKRRVERSFQVGDKVYLRLVPYQYTLLVAYPFHKLQPRFYGPFEVLAKVGSIAYKLQLPSNLKLHPVFHVSCLKKCLK